LGSDYRLRMNETAYLTEMTSAIIGLAVGIFFHKYSHLSQSSSSGSCKLSSPLLPVYPRIGDTGVNLFHPPPSTLISRSHSLASSTLSPIQLNAHPAIPTPHAYTPIFPLIFFPKQEILKRRYNAYLASSWGGGPPAPPPPRAAKNPKKRTKNHQNNKSK